MDKSIILWPLIKFSRQLYCLIRDQAFLIPYMLLSFAADFVTLIVCLPEMISNILIMGLGLWRYHKV